jgi:hypothetical protein
MLRGKEIKSENVLDVSLERLQSMKIQGKSVVERLKVS